MQGLWHEMLGVSIGTVGRDIREYQIENQVMLPYRGTIHDGRAMFLKKMKKIRAYPSNPTHSINRVK